MCVVMILSTLLFLISFPIPLSGKDVSLQISCKFLTPVSRIASINISLVPSARKPEICNKEPSFKSDNLNASKGFLIFSNTLRLPKLQL